MDASFVCAIDKWGYGYHHFISRQWNFFDPAAFELKNNLFCCDMGSHRLLFPVPLVSECERLVCIQPVKLVNECGFAH